MEYVKSFFAVIVIGMMLLVHPACAAQDTSLDVRKPVFSGSFYPGDRSTLDRMVEGYLKTAESRGQPVKQTVFGIIVPHAGYQYSGSVAAYAYSQVKGKPYKTVILLGPSHQVPFRGVAVEPKGAWGTPLSRVPINEQLARELSAKCAFIKPYARAFQQEHSLEVQLPFLQKTLKDFTIVPLIIGSMDRTDYKTLSHVLAELLSHHPGDILIVASSDMSHYYPYNQAKSMDQSTLSHIKSLNVEKLTDEMENGKSELCGAPAVWTLMDVARTLEAGVHILQYANSGDTAGDKTRVVGYSSIAFTFPEEKKGLNKTEQTMLLNLARRTVEASVLGKSLPPVEMTTPRLTEKRGAFVTLTKKGWLRGCIGYIFPVLPLGKAISEMAVAASSQDYRFSPVTKEELKDIKIEISVLSPLKVVTDPNEIKVGTHGLYITRGRQAGLLLPQVAVENKWDREEFLSQTCGKAGLPEKAWKEKGTTIYTFSAQIFSE